MAAEGEKAGPILSHLCSGAPVSLPILDKEVNGKGVGVEGLQAKKGKNSHCHLCQEETLPTERVSVKLGAPLRAIVESPASCRDAQLAGLPGAGSTSIAP